MWRIMEDYQRLLELLEDAYDAALAESRKDEEYTSWEEFKAELDAEQNEVKNGNKT